MVLSNVNKKGITLVSLVITIVVMLILAGVSISFIIGQSGLFHKADQSAKTYTRESIKEELQTAYTTATIDEVDKKLSNQEIANLMQEDLKNITWNEIAEGLIGSYKGYDFVVENNEVVMKKVETKKYKILRGNINPNAPKYFWQYSSKIKKITIKTASQENLTYPASAIEGYKWDVSLDEPGSVLAYFDNFDSTNSVYNLTILSKGKIEMPEDSSSYFHNFTNVENIEGIENLDTSKVKNMAYMFAGCPLLGSLNLGNNFDTSLVTNMQSMFSEMGKNNFTNLNLGTKFNTSNVENMSYMFQYVGWTTKQDATINLGDKFDTSKVTTMQSMFYICCPSAPTLNLNLGDKFDTSNVTTMCDIFYYCGENMIEFSLGNKFNTAKVTNLKDAFFGLGCNKMTTFHMGSGFSVASVGGNYQGAFTNCGKSTCTIKFNDQNSLDQLTKFYEKLDTGKKESRTIALEQ